MPFLPAQDILLSTLAILSVLAVSRLTKLPLASSPSNLLDAISPLLSTARSLCRAAWALILSATSHNGENIDADAEETLPTLSGSIGLISHVLCVVVSSGIDQAGSNGYVTRLFITLRQQLISFRRRGSLNGTKLPSPGGMAPVSRPRTAVLTERSESSKHEFTRRGRMDVRAGGRVVQRTQDAPEHILGFGQRRGGESKSLRAVSSGVKPSRIPRRASLGRVQLQAAVPDGFKRNARDENLQRLGTV
ncbi:hypothetical protein QBC34DRAFT_379332 [Podospora aff. communis PSN243]|uniref:Uncharacterized protein n=1 Tax=Podospora aff. communis PSN243 TaxID=3040156 RepID=A0AAV9GRP4_9PEZI|nr:hypothetical protein QBC34DRAFT_379332 [Podospora aff. communis PSN243]